MSKSADKVWFMNAWYPTETIKEVACRIAKADPETIEDEEDLAGLIEEIVKGPVNGSSQFILELQKRTK